MQSSEIGIDRKDLECPIDRLRFFSDEKLSYCEKYSVHSVRCPQNPKRVISQLSMDECERCCK